MKKDTLAGGEKDVPMEIEVLFHLVKKASKIIECVQKNTYTACEKTHLPVEKRTMHFCLS